jgi:lipopolysaccharide biosynthesis regulator YciM
MLDLLAFLLPIAALSGWYVAKRHYTRKHRIDRTQAYCRGLNYLLSEKTDKAIDIFAHILEKDCETLETHIALGNLFRRQGEVEKAIEIHERLVHEPGLSEAQKNQAGYELGMDYMRAGLFDRAESIFQTLSQTEAHCKSSLQQLLQIYQQEKDWQNAIVCLRKLLRFAKAPHGETVAQFLCELAEEAVILQRLGAARDYLAQALHADPGCARASLIKARFELASGAYGEALRTLRKVEVQNPAYLPEILQPLGTCYEHLDDDQGLIDYLGYLHRQYGLMGAAVNLAEWIREISGTGAAVGYLLTVLEANPCLRGLSRALDLLNLPDGEKPRPDLTNLNRVSRIASHLAAEIPRYHCAECGFSGSELHWRCPSCQSWGSITPV